MSKFEVTLKQLRENYVCVPGYNKVVCMLKEIEYVTKENYMKLKHDAPISLIAICENNSLEDALWCLRCNKAWNKDARLFAVWCARQMQHLMTDERSINALNIAEQYAYGNATSEQLRAAWDAARAAARATARAAASAASAASAAWDAARAASAAARAAAWDAASASASAAWDASAARAAARATAWDDTRTAQKEMFIKMCKGEAHWQVQATK